MFLRLNASSLAELPEDEGEKEWVTVRLSYGVVREARQLLQFADALEVVSPPEVRAEVAAAAASVTELYQRVGAARE
jgi:predicted DNA-binding transcriptional regulator YafY